MTYTKPELVVLTSALEGVQHVDKGLPHVLDSDGTGDFNAQINAYGADE